MSETPLFVGIDVAPAEFVVALAPTGERWAVPNVTADVDARAPHGAGPRPRAGRARGDG